MSNVKAGLQPLTRAQREVVLADDARLLVGAGAGSGKTSTVVQKLCYLLGGRVRDDEGNEYVHPAPLTLADIAAITFTTAAAADLKRKLRAALVATGLRTLASDVDAARIGTIHGFCADLLREYALRAGLAPSLTVLSEGEIGALSAQCARDAVQRAVTGRTGPHLDALYRNRSLADITTFVHQLASDSDRLATWSRNRGVLRPHELALLAIAQDALTLRQSTLLAEGATDFDRMIVVVRDLLRDAPQVRQAVQRQLRLLIIDEFQDVDPVQRDLAFLLGGLSFDDRSPTRLMLVGDPKQSVYRFRRADVAVWNTVADTFRNPGVGRLLELTDNFRSRAGILALVDTTVGPQFDQPVDLERGRQAFEVDYRPLTARGDERDGGRCVEVIAIAALDTGKARTATEVRALEASAVAARIAALHAAGESYGDMAMLFTALSDVDTYRDALRAADVPVYLLRGDGFWESREVLDCVLALRAIRDPADDVALIGFLRSPFIGLRDDTLLALREARHPAGLQFTLATSRLESELCASADALLTRFGALRDRIPAHELLHRLVIETGVLAYLAHDHDRGAQAQANVRKLLRTAAESPELSLGEFLRGVREARLRGDRVDEERLYRERADVVTITTVHSAKGLEWPIVFWCDLVREPVARKDRLECGRDCFRLKDVESDADGDDADVDEAHDELKRALTGEDSAERLRVWYVAMTRAQRLLVLGGVPAGTMGKRSASMAQSLRARFSVLATIAESTSIAYQHADGSQYELVVHFAGPSAPHPSADETEQRAADSEADTQPLSVSDLAAPPPLAVPQGRTRLSATQLLTHAADPALWWRRYAFGFESDATASPSTDGASATGASSAALGSVVHDVLERFNYDLGDITELIESAIERRDVDAPDSTSHAGHSYRRRIRELVEQAVNSGEWHALATEPTARRELTFTRILPDGSVIDGALDLVAMRESHARILDVKTGAAQRDELFAERYRVQAAVYQEAVRAIAGVDARFALLSAVDGHTVDVDTSGVSVASLVKSLRGSPG